MITLDTCSIIWNALSPEKLSKKARKAIEENEKKGLVFCEISLWEIAMLIKKERLVVEVGYQELIDLMLSAHNFILTGIDPEIAKLSVSFSEKINQDPADRIIAATSIAKKAKLITADKNLLKSKEVPTIW